MHGMTVAETTILFSLQTLGMLSFVMSHRIVTLLANRAFQGNYFPHNLSIL